MKENNFSAFVEQWIADWNSRNIDKILSHYSEDIEITTPMINMSGIGKDGKLKGKANVEKYWSEALKKFPDLKFEFIDFTVGVDCVTVFYKSVMDMVAMETMWFDSEGKVIRMNACYRRLYDEK